MGINGLLPLLRSIHRPCNLKKFAGQTIGVDAYGWLHRGTVSCAVDLALGRHTVKFVEFAMSRVRMMQHFGVVPFLVFDGDYLPSKASTEADRARRREESRRLGLDLLKRGKTAQASTELQKAVDVTPEMAGQLVAELRRVGVPFIVAPYEADAQLAYLERKGIISAIISEDSDLLVFGAKCLLTKLDQYGDCIEINRADFTACRDISLVGWSDAEFRRMAILSGCDYLANINKMGLKRAYPVVRKYKTADRIIRALQFDGLFQVPAGYVAAFRQAELTFLHQRVFCPTLKRLVLYSEPEEILGEEDLSFLGPDVEPDLALRVARGEIHPMTKEPFAAVAPDSLGVGTPLPLSRSRLRSSPSSVDDLKRGKTIDEFFKSRRVPLAELDPNRFAPSVSQQRLLDDQSNRSWPVRTAPTRATVAVAHHLPAMPSHNPADAVLPPLVQPPSRHLVTAARPPKRARLCSDENEGSPNVAKDQAECVESRFFASAASATLGKPEAEAHLFSDDSIEDAMAQLPDDFLSAPAPPDSRRPRDFQVFRDTFDDGSLPPAERATEPELLSVRTGVKAAAPSPPPVFPSKTAPDFAIPTSVPALPHDNSCASPPVSMKEQGPRLRPAATGPSSTSTVRKAASPRKGTKTSLLRRPAAVSAVRPTPLQRIGSSALGQSLARFAYQGKGSSASASTSTSTQASSERDPTVVRGSEVSSSIDAAGSKQDDGQPGNVTRAAPVIAPDEDDEESLAEPATATRLSLIA
ncbi:MAG: Rad2 nuclease [Phylliscum demangeonii]|nr:MAG: Rad2 nuclease [Phylliscum demangeonii]